MSRVTCHVSRVVDRVTFPVKPGCSNQRRSSMGLWAGHSVRSPGKNRILPESLIWGATNLFNSSKVNLILSCMQIMIIVLPAARGWIRSTEGILTRIRCSQGNGGRQGYRDQAHQGHGQCHCHHIGPHHDTSFV